MNYIYGNVKVFKFVSSIPVAELADIQFEYPEVYILLDGGSQPIPIITLTKSDIQSIVNEREPYHDIAILELTVAHILNHCMTETELDRFRFMSA